MIFNQGLDPVLYEEKHLFLFFLLDGLEFELIVADLMIKNLIVQNNGQYLKILKNL